MSLFSIGKKLIERNPSLISLASFAYNYILGRNHFRVNGKNNKLEIARSFMRKTRINIIGNNNEITFGERCSLDSSVITIRGNDNFIHLGKKVFMKNGDLWIEDDNGGITIGDKTTISGFTHLACIEGKSIAIGSDCLFSSDVYFRVGDSHSILDMHGNRINPSEDVFVGNHVWFGNKTILNKGASIANDSIVGTGAIVTKKFTQPNVIIAGVPARVIKENINWDINRIHIESAQTPPKC